MMYYKTCFIVLLLFLQNNEAPLLESHGQEIVEKTFAKLSITKIVIKSVHFNITTFSDISCDKYENQFPNATTSCIKDKDIISELERRLSALQAPKERMPLNTRAKVFIHHSDSTVSTLCVSKFAMTFNGRPVQYDKSIVRLLQISTE